MPVIARFYGIVIKMYFSQSEHGVPHFHAVYGEFNGVFAIETLEMIEGDLPARSNLGFIRLADSVLFIGKSLGSISSRSFESVLFLRYVHFSLDRNLLGKRFYDCHLFW